MSDYLGRRAARTLGLAPTVEASVPSLFLGTSLADGDATLEVTSRVAPAAEHEAEVSAVARGPLGAPKALPTSPAQRLTAWPTPLVAVPSAASFLERFTPAAGGVADDPRLDAPRPLRRPEDVRSSPTGPIAAAPRSAVPAPTPPAAEPLRPYQPAARREDHAGRAGRAEPLLAPLLPRTPPAAGEGSERARPGPGGSSTSEPPPIQITIGRIDVRATPPVPAIRPGKRRAAAAHAPDLSLQEYLATGAADRSGGGRP